MATKLPKWLKVKENGVAVADPNISYPIVLMALGIEDDMVDQYWIETAYQCTKLAVQEIILNSEFDPRPKKTLTILIEAADGRKHRWALASHKPGRGAHAATKGLEAKANYPKVAAALRA